MKEENLITTIIRITIMPTEHIERPYKCHHLYSMGIDTNNLLLSIPKYMALTIRTI
jgi:hypothetical protein